ncbi:hypothetical protein FRB94_002914 [Tulasnella sp. JGI-2019a]|nr:hypothetical protein FRB93_013934 [Tulasnella sp. JGI-2019a]KAG9013386.1 hypothetical protein FRB94_002914 [Tulasnella sp. JGI-2019a]KAG9033732.1 hypothetical protein FRB95_014419 [Tulasnella sp. JGI-2019a]
MGKGKNGKAYGIIHDECRKRGHTLTKSVVQEGMQHTPTWIIALIVDQEHMYVGSARTKKGAIKEAAIKVAEAFGMVDVNLD